MIGSSSTYSSSGSKGIITGSFGAVERLEYILESYKEALTDSIDQFAESETERIRRLASSVESSWYKLRDSLSVHYDYETGEFVYGVIGDDNDMELSMELEYGTPDSPPKPLLRTAALTGAQVSQSEITTGIRQYLGEAY